MVLSALPLTTTEPSGVDASDVTLRQRGASETTMTEEKEMDGGGEEGGSRGGGAGPEKRGGGGAVARAAAHARYTIVSRQLVTRPPVTVPAPLQDAATNRPRVVHCDADRVFHT
jgi:hypothetical protein